MFIEFQRDDDDPNISGFDMGNLTVKCDSIELTSRNDSRHRMMIYLTAVDLADQMSGMIRSEGKRFFEIVGADSSFTLAFNRDKKGLVSVSSQGMETKKISLNLVARAVLNAIERLRTDSPLPEGDAVKDDVAKSYLELRNLLI